MKFSAVVLLPLLLARSAAASSAHSSRQLRLVRAPTTSADATGEDRQLRSGGHTDHSHSRSVGAGSHGSSGGGFDFLTALAGTAPTIEQCEVLTFAPPMVYIDAVRVCIDKGGYVLNWQSDEPTPLEPGVNNVCCPAKDIDVDELEENGECTKVTGGPCAADFEGWNVVLGGANRYCCEGSVVPSSSSSSSRKSDDSSGSSSRSSSRSSSTSSSDTTTTAPTAP